MRNVILVFISMAVLSVFIALIGDGGAFLGFDDMKQKQVSFMTGVGYAVLMVFGIFAGQAHTMLGNQNMKVGGGFVKAMLTSNELWKSLLAAPIVFGAVYSMLSETSDIILASVFSFQNGFFCNSVLESKKPNN